VWNPSPIDLSSTEGANIVAKAINYINSASGTEFTLVLGENVPNVAELTLNKGVTLTITSVDNTERVISKGTANGAVFTLGNTSTATSAKLVIDGHVTLQGKSGNDSPVVQIGISSTLELRGYAKITGNNNSNDGGGVSTWGSTGNLAIVTMYDNAEISGNTSSIRGGGVILINASLTMNDSAAIKNNTADGGGGVFISDHGSAATMNGGEISGNTAQTSGGGVSIYNGSFSVASDTVKANIKNNTVIANDGEGAQVLNYGTFTVNGVAANTY